MLRRAKRCRFLPLSIEVLLLLRDTQLSDLAYERDAGNLAGCMRRAFQEGIRVLSLWLRKRLNGIGQNVKRLIAPGCLCASEYASDCIRLF